MEKYLKQQIGLNDETGIKDFRARARLGGMNEDSYASTIMLAKSSLANVLLLGRTGTGKSTLAREIHQHGPRAHRSFVAVNLASIHEETLESTLFGHERGAFTGADRARIGRLELADGGTLFLDEIGELPLSLQSRFLEFLQTKTFTPLGSNRERKVDVRIICATNRDLSAEVRAGNFREDLFHRIRVLSVELSSLGNRGSDEFAEAIHAALEGICFKAGKAILRIDNDVAELFECYSWPGNFRELENVLEVAVLTSTNGVLKSTDLPSWFIEAVENEPAFRLNRGVVIRSEREIDGIVASAQVFISRDLNQTMEKVESAVLGHFIERNRGNLARAARDAGVSRATFYRKANGYGLIPREQSRLRGAHSA